MTTDDSLCQVLRPLPIEAFNALVVRPMVNKCVRRM